MFDSLDISASALTAQRTRLDTIAANIANMNTTSDAAGRNNPYRRRFAVFAIASGVAVDVSVSISRDLLMSQFWQNWQPRLQPAVPNDNTEEPGRK